LLRMHIPNVRVHHRGNGGYDMCAHLSAVELLDADASKPSFDSASASSSTSSSSSSAATKSTDPTTDLDSFLATHVLVLNSSVRGPFLPLYYVDPWYLVYVRYLLDQSLTPPSHLFDTSRHEINLTTTSSTLASATASESASAPSVTASPTSATTSPFARLHVVGSYLSCQAHPHLQSMVIATDRHGIALMRRQFGCFSDKEDTIGFSELGLSMAALERGLRLHSLLLAYAGLDFRDPRLRNCNHRENPFMADGYFGRDVSIFETVFVKNTGTPVNLNRMSASLVADMAFYSRAKYAELRRSQRPVMPWPWTSVGTSVTSSVSSSSSQATAA
jgi:hypothetical protein